MSQLKTKATRLATVLAATLAATPAWAVQIAAYDFGASGELNNVGGGSGWSGNWSASTGISQLVAAPTGFSYQVPGGGLVSATGAVSLTGNSGNALWRRLDAAESGHVYVSFLFQYQGTAPNDNDFAVWWFDNGNTGDHTGVPNIGLKYNEGPSDRDFMARMALNPTSNMAYAPDQMVAGTTYFIVGHLYKNPATTYDYFQIWVNPAYGDSGTPEATSALDSSLSSFDRVGVRTSGLATNQRVYLGALRLGTEWRDVVPVPEPGTLALLGVGLAALGVRGAKARSGR